MFTLLILIVIKSVLHKNVLQRVRNIALYSCYILNKLRSVVALICIILTQRLKIHGLNYQNRLYQVVLHEYRYIS